jgi:cell division septation protein DedD
MATPATVPQAASGKPAEAQATDGATDKGVHANGNEQDLPRWIVNIASFSNRSEGEALVTRLGADGLKVVLREEQVQGRPSYRAVISGLESERDAKRMVDLVARNYGYNMAWALRSR